jgi:hypothetical protein
LFNPVIGISEGEEQIPQPVENTQKRIEPMEPSEALNVLRRQMLYPPELRAHLG